MLLRDIVIESTGADSPTAFLAHGPNGTRAPGRPVDFASTKDIEVVDFECVTPLQGPITQSDTPTSSAVNADPGDSSCRDDSGTTTPQGQTLQQSLDQGGHASAEAHLAQWLSHGNYALPSHDVMPPSNDEKKNAFLGTSARLTANIEHRFESAQSEIQQKFRRLAECQRASFDKLAANVKALDHPALRSLLEDKAKEEVGSALHGTIRSFKAAVYDKLQEIEEVKHFILHDYRPGVANTVSAIASGTYANNRLRQETACANKSGDA
ncbi:hypothetical protein BESB_053430 [Besnoitia besnoiti]|uniref:Uncharacterized protein n=1 Tax=Besnoitia besnoiti TaxID=94643 RepID=A0A2A9MJX1_BESBE|nr:hypothetical protein BESB_053430 [Besnoitia besnoiti]PFH35692.1 hypothetical protein BESB_053430 [Besnoitia besnoiti]